MIEVKNLTKKYENHTAIENISFTMEPGKIYGLLGKNGAGKSTTMNLMTGYLAPSGGTVIIDGYDILKDAKKAKAKIGYLPEIPPLYKDMTVEEYLSFAAALKDVAKKERAACVEEAMEETKISSERRRLIKNLSKGYQQRVGIAQAMLSHPMVLILQAYAASAAQFTLPENFDLSDLPAGIDPAMFQNLDPAQIAEIRKLIRKLGESHIVLLSSHILSEISEVCDHVFILSDGKLILSESTENLSLHVKERDRIQIEAKGKKEDAERVLLGLKTVKEYQVVSDKEDKNLLKITVLAKGNRDIREEVSLALSKEGVIILSMQEAKQSLEDVFLALTDEKEEVEK